MNRLISYIEDAMNEYGNCVAEAWDCYGYKSRDEFMKFEDEMWDEWEQLKKLAKENSKDEHLCR